MHEFIAACPSEKTALGTQVALKAAKAGRRVVYLAFNAFVGEVEVRVVFEEIKRIATECGVLGVDDFSFQDFRHGRRQDLVNGAKEAATDAAMLKLEEVFPVYAYEESFRHDPTTGLKEATAMVEKLDADLLIVDCFESFDIEDRPAVLDLMEDSGIPIMSVSSEHRMAFPTISGSPEGGAR